MLAVVIALFRLIVDARVAALVADEAGVADVGADVVVGVAVDPQVGARGEFRQVRRPVGGMEQADGFGVVALGDEFEARHEVADDHARFRFRIERGLNIGAARQV